jgi:hypothetical protein
MADPTPDHHPGLHVTTSSGKPPLDEQVTNPGWDSGSDEAAAGSDADASKARRADEKTPPPAAAASDAAPQIYGTGVPYGGDDRTEEIDPVVLEAPFIPEERKRPPAAPRPPQRGASSAPLRDMEMKAPVAQLVLSDLFDSTPPHGSMAPPDPAAFSSSRPPPGESAPSTPHAARSGFSFG